MILGNEKLDLLVARKVARFQNQRGLTPAQFRIQFDEFNKTQQLAAIADLLGVEPGMIPFSITDFKTFLNGFQVKPAKGKITAGNKVKKSNKSKGLLVNRFHNRSVEIPITDPDLWILTLNSEDPADRATAKRYMRKICASRDCACETVFQAPVETSGKPPGKSKKTSAKKLLTHRQRRPTETQIRKALEGLPPGTYEVSFK